MTPDYAFALEIVKIVAFATLAFVAIGLIVAKWDEQRSINHQRRIDDERERLSRLRAIRPRRSNRERRAVSSRRCIVQAAGRVWP